MTDLRKIGSLATLGLGLGQALAPQATARAFGLAPLDGQGLWLARLLGTANVAFGAMGLDEDAQKATRTTLRGVLAGNAAVALAGAASGSVPKRTTAMVLAFVGALAAADATAG
jgi:hypothetical protein